MAKRQKKKNFLLPRWLPLATFTIGLSLGIVSQRISQIKIYTDELIQYAEQQIAHQQVSQSVVKGAPISSFHIDRAGYSLAYDARNRNPIWVYEHLTADRLVGSTDRSHFDFKEDTNIPLPLRASPFDYRGQGFDRGHLAPAANHRSSAEAMADTFFMTNMCPQCPQLNRGYWCKLEKHVRDLTKNHKNVYVVTGPLYMPYTDTDGKRYVKYQLIGKNDVAVPSHFFKIITLEDNIGHLETQAYILPNENIPANTALDTFRAPIEKIEKLAGLILSNKG